MAEYPTASHITAAAARIEKTADNYTVYRYDENDDLQQIATDVPIAVQPFKSVNNPAVQGEERQDDFYCFVPLGYDVKKGDVMKIDGVHYVISEFKKFGTHVEFTLRESEETDG